MEAITGARAMRRAVAARGGSECSSAKGGSARRDPTYSSIIGVGDGQIMATIAALLNSGGGSSEQEQLRLLPTVDKAFRLKDCAEALAELRAGHVAGKIVLVHTAEAVAELEARHVPLQHFD